MNIEENYNKVFRYCYYRLQNRQMAEDITQETFLRFLNSGYEEQQKEIRYLYTIARNLCIDEARKQKVSELPPDYEHSDGGGGAADLENHLFMKDILAKLTEEERALLVLRYVNEEPFSVICKELQVSRFSLYRKLKSATKKLQNLTEGGIGNE